jgi:hypothetical protein
LWKQYIEWIYYSNMIDMRLQYIHKTKTCNTYMKKQFEVQCMTVEFSKCPECIHKVKRSRYFFAIFMRNLILAWDIFLLIFWESNSYLLSKTQGNQLIFLHATTTVTINQSEGIWAICHVFGLFEVIKEWNWKPVPSSPGMNFISNESIQ